MVEYPAPKLDESPEEKNSQSQQQSAPNTGNGAARKAKAIVTKDLADIGTLIQGAQNSLGTRTDIIADRLKHVLHRINIAINNHADGIARV